VAPESRRLGKHAVAGEGLIESSNHPPAWPVRQASQAPAINSGSQARVRLGLLRIAEAANRRGLGRFEQGGCDRPQGEAETAPQVRIARSPCPASGRRGCSSPKVGLVVSRTLPAAPEGMKGEHGSPHSTPLTGRCGQASRQSQVGPAPLSPQAVRIRG